MTPSLKRIVIIGPESTGKSTLTEDLATYFQRPWVPEYARSYLDQLGRPYEEEDLWVIAQGQLAAEDQAAQQAGKGFLFCDTDLYVLKVWSEHKYGRCDERILRKIAERPYDFYLLTDIDIPWISDPQREHPQPEMRAYFLSVYEALVQESTCPWTKISGSRTERLSKAVEVLKKHFLV